MITHPQDNLGKRSLILKIDQGLLLFNHEARTFQFYNIEPKNL